LWVQPPDELRDANACAVYAVGADVKELGSRTRRVRSQLA